MDLSKLNSLSTDTLQEMNRHIVGVLRHRQALTQMNAGAKLKINGKATFVDRLGRTVTVRVDKINVKSVNCSELNERGVTTKNWRVAPTLLTPLSDAPATVAAGATW